MSPPRNTAAADIRQESSGAHCPMFREAASDGGSHGDTSNPGRDTDYSL